ncbi:hypothetical protein DL768_008586 [Monosporascus sp. mg162]|nr:hypothetical protein DL768_008586 [Monosporascus sp. mg162]
MSAAKKLADDNPFAILLEHAEGRLRFSSVKHMLAPVECAFTEPDPAVSQFDSLAERSVKLASAIRGEHDFESALNALAYKRPHKAFAVNIAARRTENDHTGKTYRTACFIHLPSPENYDLLPKEGQTGWMITNVPFQMDDALSFKPTEKQIVAALVREIAESVWLVRQIRGSDEEQLAYIRETLDRVVLPAQPNQDQARTTFIRIRSRKLRFTRVTKDKSGNPMPAETDEQHRARVKAFVAEHRSKMAIPQHTYEQDTHRYTFTAIIARESDDGALKARLSGVARATPLRMQDHSPFHKYIKWLLDFHGPIDKHKFYDLFPSLAHLKDRIDGKPAFQSTFHAASPKRSTSSPSPEAKGPTEVTDEELVVTDEEPTVTDKEPSPAAQALAQAPATKQAPIDEDGPPQILSVDQVTFDKETSDAMLSLYESLDEDQKAVFTNLHEVDFGHLMCSGCPGSGKTTT